MSDPTEKIVAEALDAAGIKYHRDGARKGRAAKEQSKGLDFFLPNQGIYIECKRFHSPRIAEQLKRDPNIIVIQGERAARVFAWLLSDRKSLLEPPQ